MPKTQELLNEDAYVPNYNLLYESISKRDKLFAGEFVFNSGTAETVQDHQVCALGSLVSDCSLALEARKNKDIEFRPSNVYVHRWTKNKSMLLDKVKALIQTGFFFAKVDFVEDYLVIGVKSSCAWVMNQNDSYAVTIRKSAMLTSIKEHLKGGEY